MTSNHRKYLLLLILIFTASTAFGQKLDTLSFVNCNISYIADFNEDTYLDTLVSINYNHCNFPYYIIWANPNNLASIKPKSVIKYPEYYSFKVTSNCVDMNTDNASDLIFTVRYKVKVDSVTYLDSAYNVILFG